MLFNSFLFIGAFLPIVRILFGLANRVAGAPGGVAALVVASLVFYAAWNPSFLALLLPSIALNWAAARRIQSCLAGGRARSAGVWLAASVSANLSTLAWFKYAHFLAASVSGLLGVEAPGLAAVLPLGISFFTFEQIGYLVDVRRGGRAEANPLRYALFVAFFPRLVAGPILRFTELMPQIPRAGQISATGLDIAVGLSMFAMGLAKKSLLADGIAPFAGSVFGAAAHGAVPTPAAAWAGTLAYSLQLYFDFSGYSDMAIGSARLFGLRFPENFNSPYKSTSIIEFWRRWHMTLSRFLRDYLYVPLGGNRRGQARRFVNLFATMLLGGLWHGANWTFVAWGALHGAYLIVNHAWHALERRVPGVARASDTPPGRLAAWALTMFAVLVGWVFFRAPDFATGNRILGSMLGYYAGQAQPLTDPAAAWLWIAGLAAVALLGPASQQILGDWAPVLEQGASEPSGFIAWPRWRPVAAWGAATAVVALAGLLCISDGGEFLYWRF